MEINKFVWDDSFSVEVKEMDEQHKHFFSIVNEIYDLILSGDVQKEKLMFNITNLGNYAVYHLSTEEALFNEFDFEWKNAHIAAHNLFRDKVTKYMGALDDPNTDMTKLSLEVADFCKTWLSEHIKVMDKGYIACFHQHGIN